MFQIPAAPRGGPVDFGGHYYGRDGEELSPLNLEEIERIRSQSIIEDWSAIIVRDATINDLDRAAIEKARKNYKDKFPGQSVDVDSWNDLTFLNKAKLTIKGKLPVRQYSCWEGQNQNILSVLLKQIRRRSKDAKEMTRIIISKVVRYY